MKIFHDHRYRVRTTDRLRYDMAHWYARTMVFRAGFVVLALDAVTEVSHAPQVGGLRTIRRSKPVWVKIDDCQLSSARPLRAMVTRRVIA